MSSISKIIIIDYNRGNLYSVQHALLSLGFDSTISSNKKDIENADAVILPGVGAFGDAMENLIKLDLIVPIKEFINSGRPFMGICLGMQLLFSESYEFGIHKGLDIIQGHVEKFNCPHRHIKVPQIGWNKILMSKGKTWDNTPLSSIKNESFMYFVHSFFVKPIETENILSYTNYEGIEYCSSIYVKNIFATQFHPENSSRCGIEIYKKFLNN